MRPYAPQIPYVIRQPTVATSSLDNVAKAIPKNEDAVKQAFASVRRS